MQTATIDLDRVNKYIRDSVASRGNLTVKQVRDALEDMIIGKGMPRHGGHGRPHMQKYIVARCQPMVDGYS